MRLPGGIRALALAGAGAGALSYAMLAHFEGERTKPYLDVVGVPTKCYGETSDVDMSVEYTHEQCEAYLHTRITTVQAFVYRYAGYQPPATTAALVSFTYNVGEGNARSSTVFRKMREGHPYAGCDALPYWNKIRRGKLLIPLDALTARREAERELCRLGLDLELQGTK